MERSHGLGQHKYPIDRYLTFFFFIKCNYVALKIISHSESDERNKKIKKIKKPQTSLMHHNGIEHIAITYKIPFSRTAYSFRGNKKRILFMK